MGQTMFTQWCSRIIYTYLGLGPYNGVLFNQTIEGMGLHNCNVVKPIINHPPVTINRWYKYKPFPNGWFMTLFYLHDWDCLWLYPQMWRKSGHYEKVMDKRRSRVSGQQDLCLKQTDLPCLFNHHLSCLNIPMSVR